MIKATFFALATLTSCLAISSYAKGQLSSDDVRGTIVKNNGKYYLETDNQHLEIKVINNEYIEDYVDEVAIIQGEKKNGIIDADLVTVELDEGNMVVFDWEEINDELYED